ncbi:MAG: beta-propeller domain-containing protein [Candidatus Micrarchaeota archaeon]
MDLTKIFGLGAVILLVFGAVALTTPGLHAEDQPKVNTSLNTFSSCGELRDYVKENAASGGYGYWGRNGFMLEMAMDAVSAPAPSAEGGGQKTGASDYSGTNVQVEGVDEADIVKSDGEYLYIFSRGRVVIVDAYPALEAKKLSEIETGSYSAEFFVNGDKLVIFANEDYQSVGVKIYDISDRQNPELEEDLVVDGYYVNSRMIGDYVYLIASEPVYYWLEGGKPLPEVKKDGLIMDDVVDSCGCSEVQYFDDMPQVESFTSVVSIDLESGDVSNEVFVTGSAEGMYVSQDNIYLVHTTYGYEPGPSELAVAAATGVRIWKEAGESTIIHKLSIDAGDVGYIGKGAVPGHVLNQFSMDEYDGSFRIATTVGNVARNADQATSVNNLYILDTDMGLVGALEDLAPGEKIYSARFMGKRAYVVTFRKVDPLFVIDLEDPENPEVLGKLKIPGYSDYLHPYDENHIIGLGKDAIPADEGDFSWYQGVKLSLFDVSDVEHPKEISVVSIGDRGTESYALHDHRAFLFDREKNLLVIPVLLAEIHEEQYPEGLPPYASGDYTYQGAYVFGVSPEEGFSLRGKVTHLDGEDAFEKSGYYFDSEYSVKRSLYMDDVLYTISDMKVKMNGLGDLGEVNEVALD